MKNIAILVPTLAGGGAERVAGNISKGLSKSFNIDLIVYDGNQVEYDYSGNLISLDSKLYKTPIGKSFGVVKKVFQIRKIKKERNIDATISFLDNANIINILSRRNDKVLISVRNFKSSEGKGFYGKVGNFLIKIFYNKSDTVIACSEVIREDLIQNFNVKENKVVTIYNPYDIDKIQSMAKEDISNDGRIKGRYLINVGRLTYQKGQEHLLRAFKLVLETINDINLVIVGQGELESKLKNEAKELGIEQNVVFLGFEKNPFKYVSKSEGFVLSSLYEGFPNCLVEAMVCGVPIISSDCKSGPREILTDNFKDFRIDKDSKEEKYGIIVPDFSDNLNIQHKEQELANAIIKLLNNKELKTRYIGASNNRHKDFSLDNISSQFKEAIDKLI